MMNSYKSVPFIISTMCGKIPRVAWLRCFFFGLALDLLYQFQQTADEKMKYVTALLLQNEVASQITGVSIVSKLRVTGFCERNPSVTGGFHSQRASNAETVSIRWRHHDIPFSAPGGLALATSSPFYCLQITTPVAARVVASGWTVHACASLNPGAWTANIQVSCQHRNGKIVTVATLSCLVAPGVRYGPPLLQPVTTNLLKGRALRWRMRI